MQKLVLKYRLFFAPPTQPKRDKKKYRQESMIAEATDINQIRQKDRQLYNFILIRLDNSHSKKTHNAFLCI
jgi:hypothetical protein